MASFEMIQNTLDAFEERIARLNTILFQDVQDPSTESDGNTVDLPIAARLQRLESSMESLKANSAVVRQLCELHTRYPDAFEDQDAAKDKLEMPSDTALQSIVMSHAPSYQSTSSQLTSLNDVPVPDAGLSASLIALQPRLNKALARDDEQGQMIADLQTRSAQVLSRWHELGVVGMGECWSEWESRLTNAERSIRREEHTRSQEDGMS